MLQDDRDRVWLYVGDPPWSGHNAAVYYDLDKGEFVAGGSNQMFTAFALGEHKLKNNLEGFESLMFSANPIDREAAVVLFKCFEGYGETQTMKDWDKI